MLRQLGGLGANGCGLALDMSDHGVKDIILQGVEAVRTHVVIGAEGGNGVGTLPLVGSDSTIATSTS